LVEEAADAAVGVSVAARH
jgi:hypothetical protein